MKKIRITDLKVGDTIINIGKVEEIMIKVFMFHQNGEKIITYGQKDEVYIEESGKNEKR